MTEKEKKVGCPFCSRESNRPNNVVVHIMGQHQGLCKEKISRIRSPVPSVAMREAMLLFMKDKFESDDTIRTLLEENEKLRWAVASLGGRPGTAPIVPPTLMTSSSSSSGYLQPDHFPDTYPQEVGRHPKHPKKEKSEEEEEEADSEDGDTLSSGKKRKASKISSAGPMKAKAKQPSSRGNKKRRVPSEEEEEEEAKEISPPLSEEEGEETVCIVRWHDMVVTILTRYLNWLSAENIEEEEAKDFFFLVPNSCLPGRPKAGRKGKEKDLAYQTISLQQLRQLFGHSTFTVQEARRFVRFEKLLEELDMSGLALVANKSFIGTVDSSQTQLGERLADKLLSTVDQHEEDAAEFERAVSQEAEEWERRNAVETFKNFLVSMPQSFADVLLTMHPILENITLARVEKSSLQQRVQRIGELLAASKARIASKIADNGMHLGISKRQLELELALSEEMATRAINKSTESDAEEVLRGCLRSFIGMKRVLHSFHQLLRGVYESETKPILEKPTAPKLAPSTGYSSDSSNVYISNVGTPSYSMETTPACQSYSRFDASAKRSYAFTQAMSRLLNAIHLCTPAVDSKAQQQLASAQTSTRQQQPQPRQKQTKVQQQPTPARAVAPYPPQAYMMAPPPFGGFEMGQQYGLLSGQHPPPQPIFYAQPVVPFTPIVSRPVTSSAYPPTANNSPPSSQRSSGATASNKETHKVKTSEKKSAFTSPKRAFSSSTSLDESHALSALQALADTAVHQECRGVYRKTYVFLIALEAFRDKTLASRLGAAEDVHLLETAFAKLPGCHVRTLINEQASKDNIRASFLSDMAGAASNDRVMIFMETQGIIARTSSGEQVGVLCAHETNTADPATGILPSELLEWIPHARHVALFLDAPYAATGLFPFDNPSYPVTWENLLSKLAAQYLWSGERGGTARTGIFLNTLKEAFEGAVFEHYRKDWVKMSELCAWVCDAVFRSTKGRQEPQGGKVLGNSATMGGEGGGEVIFLRPDVSCLPIELSTPDPRTAKKSRGSLTPYVTLDVKEFRYCGFSVVPNSPTPVVVEKYKVMIEDQAHGIIVGETECLDRNSAVAASVEEYIKNLRVKEPSILLSSAKVLSELLKETAGAMYTVTIAVD